MFGKGKAKTTSTQKFIMSQGRKAGNVFGNHSGPAGKSGKASKGTYEPRTLKVGKNSMFDAE